MFPIKTFVATPKLPHSIEKLKELAYNYYWCWNSEAREVFIRMDRELWEEVSHNPVQLINKIPYKKLIQLSEQPDFTNYLDYIYEKYHKYMNSETWFSNNYSDKQTDVIAYFSPEYGINESFPNYSGGLGVLSGDHIKSSSDLGLPLVGIGLLYQEGYFRQQLSNNGWQNEIYNYNDFYTMPLLLVRDENGEPLKVYIDMPVGSVCCYIWQLNVGRTKIYFLDTNVQENANPEIRKITNQLYGGDRETRIQQEIVLGIGGIRALELLKLTPAVVHINEGHAAFALLERTKQIMEKYNLNFQEAKNLNTASAVFTTHTPVPAGNEAFDLDKIDNYLNYYYKVFDLSKEQFAELGQFGEYDASQSFSMTILGLRFTAYRNGVSKLHGSVSRKMWSHLWKEFPLNEVPITSITNGIHTTTWVAREFSELFDRYLSPSWRISPDSIDWNKVQIIPSEEIWREKQRRRTRLVLFTRDYLRARANRLFNFESKVNINDLLNPDTLTIGFARRFATYKRANLIFKNMDRLKQIVTNSKMPVQIIIAGKAHPQDTQGKEVIQSIIRSIKEAGLERQIVFLEDYNMAIARMMVKGCDIWLNNPIRPLEASGTSGMKAALNGTLNLSVLDGWWDEGYNGSNGFAIGFGEEHENNEEYEVIESEMIYSLLEDVIVPMFYDRNNTRIPENWVQMMKNCIQTNAPMFSTSRMLKEYTQRFYIPALDNYCILSQDNALQVKKLQAWKEKIKSGWDNIKILSVNAPLNNNMEMNTPIPVEAVIDLGNLSPEDVEVQVYFGSINHNKEFDKPLTESLIMNRRENNLCYFNGHFTCQESGMQGVTVRILPKHPLLVNCTEMNLCKWA